MEIVEGLCRVLVQGLLVGFVYGVLGDLRATLNLKDSL